MWQLALMYYLTVTLNFVASRHDENLLYWMDGHNVLALILVQVDDLLIGAAQALLDWLHWKLKNNMAL